MKRMWIDLHVHAAQLLRVAGMSTAEKRLRACSMDSRVSLRSAMLVCMSNRPASMTSLAMSILIFWILLRTSDSMLSAYMLPGACPFLAFRCANQD